METEFLPSWRRPGKVVAIERGGSAFLVPASPRRFHPDLWQPFSAPADPASLVTGIARQLQMVDVSSPKALATLASKVGFLTPMDVAGSRSRFAHLEQGEGTPHATTWCERVSTAQLCILEYRLAIALKATEASRRLEPPEFLRESSRPGGGWELVMSLPSGVQLGLTEYSPDPPIFFKYDDDVVSIDMIEADTPREAASLWYSHLAARRLPVWEGRDELVQWYIGAPLGVAWHRLHYAKHRPRRCKSCGLAFTISELSRRGHGSYCSVRCRVAAARRRAEARKRAERRQSKAEE